MVAPIAMLVVMCCTVFEPPLRVLLAAVIPDPIPIPDPILGHPVPIEALAIVLLSGTCPCNAELCIGARPVTDDSGGSTGGLKGGVSGSVSEYIPSLSGGSGSDGGAAQDDNGVSRTGEEFRGGRVVESAVSSWLTRMAMGRDASGYGDTSRGWRSGE